MAEENRDKMKLWDEEQSLRIEDLRSSIAARELTTKITQDSFRQNAEFEKMRSAWRKEDVAQYVFLRRHCVVQNVILAVIAVAAVVLAVRP